MAWKFTWGNKAKHCWVMSTNFLKTKSLLTIPSNVLPIHFKQTFPPIIWIFTKDEGDAIESRLPFKKNSTLPEGWPWQNFDTMSHHTHFMQRRLPIENNQITIANMPLNFVATLQMQIRRLGMKSQIDSFTWKGEKIHNPSRNHFKRFLIRIPVE